jgi:L-asparagine oxygenase
MSVGDGPLELTAEERDEFAEAIDGLPAFDIRRLDETVADELTDWSELVPSRVADGVLDLRAGTIPSCRLVVRNLPVDPELPPTPQDGGPSPTKSTRVSEYTLLLLASIAGEVVGYEEEKDGLLVHDVSPKPGSEERQENTGSVFFDLHTENAFHPLTPDLLSLVCLRPDHDREARTLVASARDIADALPRSDVEVLRAPLFQTRMPTSFLTEPDAEEVLSDPQPVLTGRRDDPRICVDSFNTVPTTAEAERSLRELVRVLKSKLDGPALEPGDLLMVDNRRAVHARTAFRPRYDGEDRWLQRVYAVCEPRKVEWIHSSGTHVCGGLPVLETVGS